MQKKSLSKCFWNDQKYRISGGTIRQRLYETLGLYCRNMCLRRPTIAKSKLQLGDNSGEKCNKCSYMGTKLVFTYVDCTLQGYWEYNPRTGLTIFVLKILNIRTSKSIFFSLDVLEKFLKHSRFSVRKKEMRKMS